MANNRDKAVENVDARHGYTYEFSSSPEAHLQEYDEEEQRLRRTTPPEEYWLDFTVSLVTSEEPSYILTENLRAKIEEELRVWKHDPGIVVSFKSSRKVDKVTNAELAIGGE